MPARCSIFAVDRHNLEVHEVALYNEAPTIKELTDAVAELEKKYGVVPSDVRVVSGPPSTTITDIIRRFERSSHATDFCDHLAGLVDKAIVVLTATGPLKYVVTVNERPKMMTA